MLDELVGSRLNLVSGRTYRLVVNGVTVDIATSDDWTLYGYQTSGDFPGAMMAWNGPTGTRAETLNVLIYDIGVDEAAAWERIEAIGDRAERRFGEPWAEVLRGTASVAGIPVEWREFRTPIVADSPGELDRIWGSLDTQLWSDTSARFHVVPVGDLTITVMAYETRCACRTQGDGSIPRGNQWLDDEENELWMWLPELYEFLAGMEIAGN